MLYSSVEIKPTSCDTRKNKTGWSITYYDIPYQRENVPARPYPVGFYHYKRSLGIEKAFDELKTEMIRCRLAEIDKLTASILSLQKLKLPVRQKG